MKKFNFEKTSIAIVAVLLLCLAGFLVIESGLFAKEPVVEVTARNRYNKTITVATDKDYSPYSFRDAKGKPSGHDVELITMIANKLQMNLDLRLTDWDDGIVAVTSGQADVLMTCDSDDNFRGMDKVLKTQPVSIDEFICYSKKKLDDVTSLYGKRIGVMKEGNVTSQVRMMGLDKYCTEYESNKQAMEALARNEVDVAIARQNIGTSILRELNASGINGYVSLGQSYMCFGVNAKDKELANKINLIIEEMKENGELTKLRNKWLTTFVRPYSISEVLLNNVWIVIAFVLAMVALILTSVRNRLQRIKDEEEKYRNALVVDHLAQDFTCVNYVEMQQNKLEDIGISFRTSELLMKEIPGWDKEKIFSKKMDLIMNNVVYEPDRQQFYEDTRRENIVAKLQEEDAYFVNTRFFIDGEIRYHQMKISAVREDGRLVGFVAGLHSVDEAVRKDLEVKKHLKQVQKTKQLLDRFVSDYKASFVVNTKTDTYRALHNDEDAVAVFGDNPSFSHAFQNYAARVYEADRTMVMFSLNLKNIEHRFEKENEYSVRYRNISNGYATWYEMRFSKLNEDEFVLAFADVDDLVAAEMMQDAFSENCYGAFLLDLETDTVKVVKYEGSFHGIKAIAKEHYTNVFSRFIVGLSEKARHEWEGLETVEGVKKFLHDQDKREFVFESPYRENKLVRCSWFVADRKGYEANTVCFGFEDLDEEQADRIKLHEQIAEQLETIGGVASEYTALYHVHLDLGDYKPYAVSSKIEDIKAYIARNPKFYGLIKEFINSDLVHPEHRRRLHEFYPSDEAVRDKLADRKKISALFKRNYSGEFLWTEMDVIKCEDLHEPAHMVVVGFKEVDEAVMTRIEQQEKIEEALKIAEVANKSKTSFLFNMSHDIRTPMNAITGFTNMAQKNVQDPEKVSDCLSKINIAGSQLLGLINQVLEMSRIESGKIEFDNRPVNIFEEFNSLVTILSAQARANGLEFRSSLSGITHYNVLADDARMGQITLNITGNALKYTPEGGRIDYSLTEIPCEREGYARYLFTVADTGIGMSKEYQKVLFEPFSREESATVSHIQGTGLGMSIVKDLVDLLGGTITVESELGKGSKFDVTVDLKIDDGEKAVETVEAEKVETAALAGHKVLLVEDNDMNREIATYILTEDGMKVETAVDGQDAVNKVLKRGAEYYDFILMDIQMPVMDGYAATKKIRELIPELKAPIIALSANAFDEDRQRSLAAGMNEHISKPIDVKQLNETMAKFL